MSFITILRRPIHKVLSIKALIHDYIYLSDHLLNLLVKQIPQDSKISTIYVTTVRVNMFVLIYTYFSSVIVHFIGRLVISIHPTMIIIK